MRMLALCTVETAQQTADIVRDLKLAAFLSTDISVFVADEDRWKAAPVHDDTLVAEATAAGAGAGALLGGGVGLLAGLGALAIPGVGPFLAAGPLVAALTGMAVGGTVGGMAGALVGLGIPEDEARYYEERLRDDRRSLIAVYADTLAEVDRARQIFADAGAGDIRVTTDPNAASPV